MSLKYLYRKSSHTFKIKSYLEEKKINYKNYMTAIMELIVLHTFMQKKIKK